MAFHRGMDGFDPLPPERIGQVGGDEELRPQQRSSVMAVGTLACPECDAPVAPGDRPLAPSDALACPFCLRAGRVREFLSLATTSRPARPARVVIRVSAPAAR